MYTYLFLVVFLKNVFADNLFDNYLHYNNIKISNEEYNYREKIFLSEYKRVIEHNKKNLTWKEEINVMSHLTNQEKIKFLGVNKLQAQINKNNFIEYYYTDNIPDMVDWRQKCVTSSVKDQGYCGSCWAFASVATIESHVAINTGKLFDLSPQQIASCTTNFEHCGGQGNCQGATAELAFDYVANSNGLLEEYQYSYTSYYGNESECNIPKNSIPKVKIDGYTKLPTNNYQALLYALATYGPIAVSVDASNWHAYSHGIFNGCNQRNPDINHAVVLVGYGEENGEKYWLVRNSWSASWGENCYIRLARNDDEDQICGIDGTPWNGVACDGQTTPQITCGTCGILYDSTYPNGATIA